MSRALKRARRAFERQSVSTSDHRQVGAICYRAAGTGLEILLITSRDTGRWVLPKGWRMEGKSAVKSALTEAWEEAGVTPGRTEKSPLGCFEYDKRLADGEVLPLRVDVFLVEVAGLAARYPEADERRRVWATPQEAAEMVQEPGLKTILRGLEAA